MTFNAVLMLVSALLCGGLAAVALIKNAGAFVYWVFAAGMGMLAVAQLCAVMAAQTLFPVNIVRWEYRWLVVSAPILGLWLLFSLGFARGNAREVITRWRWVLLGAFGVPLATVMVFHGSFFSGPFRLDPAAGWTMPLGWSGYMFYLGSLLIAVLGLVNLERTLRVSTGSMRWRIKFMLLGVGCLFAGYIYTHSQILLFSAVTSAAKTFIAAAVILADVLILMSLRRHHGHKVEIELSRTALYNSITVFVVGIYLLAAGVLAKAIGHFEGKKALPVGEFFTFLASVLLAVVLLSDELRQRLKRVIARHVYHSRYDYRRAWTRFTQRTTSVMDIQELCAVVAKIVAETFGVPAVTVWLIDEKTPQRVLLGGSTVFSRGQMSPDRSDQPGARALADLLRQKPGPIDFEHASAAAVQELKATYPDYFRQTRLHYGVALMAAQQLLGFITLDDRLTHEPFSVEDVDLLKTFADQAAASLLNLRLSQQLLQAKELEAFETLSAFFVHDLKNLAAKLSLMVQNLPMHYDNPAFREDMLRVISASVEKMNALCSRVSLLTTHVELHRVDADFNELVRTTLHDLQNSLKAPLIQDLQPVPTVSLDTKQVQKVLANLILNAQDAVGAQGEIRVRTGWQSGWAMLTVEDNGCGMSRVFLERSLFQPFQTTKSQGLGIGLFHSKMIVEAHGGRIEVESQEGEGTTFRILLPAGVGNDATRTRLRGRQKRDGQAEVAHRG